MRQTCSWPEASIIAQEKGGYLASITDAYENAKMIDYLKGLSRSGRTILYNTWLGGNDLREEGVWEWFSGEAWSFQDWLPGEPNNKDNEDYLYVLYTSLGSQWNDFLEFDPNHTEWEPKGLLIEYGYPSNPLVADTDGDGLSDLREHELRTNPNLISSQLTVIADKNGKVTLNRPSGVYEQGTLVVATATPIEGFTFKQWVGAIDSSENPVYWEFDGPNAISAVFEPESGFSSDQQQIGLVDAAPEDRLRITFHPQDKQVAMNATGSLVVVAEFVKPATGSNMFYQWFQDGVAIDGANSSVLLIQSMSLINQGTYHVEISTGFQSVKSNTATLGPIMPLSLQSPYKEFFLEIGMPFQNRTLLNNQTQLIELQWFKNGRQLSNHNDLNFFDARITSADAGLYAIRASDGYSDLMADVFRIIPIEGPCLDPIQYSDQSSLIQFYGVDGQNYGIYKSSNLADWELLNVITGQNESVSYLDSFNESTSQGFYQIIRQ